MAIRQRPKHAMCKPNVIPILDAVFIFIFFLLLSSEFLNIKQINTTMPMVKNAANVSKDLKPLNLTVFITKKYIILKTGLDLTIHKKIKRNNKFDIAELGETITQLKKLNPSERTANISPSRNIKFKDIIKIIDVIKTPSSDLTQKGFNQIVFDSN